MATVGPDPSGPGPFVPAVSDPDRGHRLAALRERVRRLEGGGGAIRRARPFGCAGLDAALPPAEPGGGEASGMDACGMGACDRGLPLGCLHEVRGDRGAATGFAAHLLARVADGRPVVWVGRTLDLYAPGLAALGLTPERLLVVRARRPAEVLWAMEEALTCARLGAVLGEGAEADLTASRRLQLAAEASGVTAVLLAGAGQGEASAAVTRWQVDPAPSVTDEPGLGPPRWAVRLLRCRGGRPGAWTLELGPDGLSEVPEPATVHRPDAVPEVRRMAVG